MRKFSSMSGANVIYNKLKDQGAQFIDNYGWEKPKWFSKNQEKETRKRWLRR